MFSTPKHCTFHDNQLDCTGTTQQSRYSSEMKALNAAYRLSPLTPVPLTHITLKLQCGLKYKPEPYKKKKSAF
jgi:hypothetical protein